MRVAATTMGAKLHNSAQNANGWDWKSEVSATLRTMTPYATRALKKSPFFMTKTENAYDL